MKGKKKQKPMTPNRWFLGFLKKYAGYMIAGEMLSLVIPALHIINPRISGAIVDRVIMGGEVNILLPLLGCMLGVILVKSILRYIYQLVFETASQGVLYDMRDKVYRKLLQEDFGFYNKKRTGDLMSRQTGDMEAIRHFVAYVIYQCTEQVIMLIIAIVMIFTISWKMALMMLAVLPFTALCTYFQSKAVKPAFKRNRDHFSSLNAFVQENVSGNRVVRAFSKEDFEIQKFQKENDGFRDSQVAASKVWMKYVPIFEVLAYSLNIILMMAGGYMVMNDPGFTLGNLVTISGYLWMLNNPLRMAGWLVNDIGNFTTSVEKIYATYSEEPDVKTPVKGKRTKLRGAISFENVSYKVGDETIVQDISFHAAPGQTIGIIGSTGSGKSTIMNLLCRFYDVTDGCVRVDDEDVRNLDLYNLRDNIGMAMQDVFLFSDTIEGNIAYGRPGCSFEDVKHAAVMADADPFISEMADGYDTIVGERGVGLSGGQKQRISLARALLKDPSILILDDTTSAVDMETESYIQQQLKNIGRKCTIFIIAYRISSIRDADLILVMDKGRIIESGTHETLLAKGGYYTAAFKNQYGEIPEELKKGGDTDGQK